MTRTRQIGLFWLLFSSSIFILWGSSVERASQGGMADFKAVFYGARCLMHHYDPYKESEFLRVYREDGGKFPSDPAIAPLFNRAIPVCINLPTSLFLIVPFAILPWGLAHLLWMALVACCLTLAAFLVWNLAGDSANGLSLLLICLVLSNSEILFASGNLAGIAVSLCIVSVWCFLKKRFVIIGIFCLAVSLVIKPHDAGLVWLYFLLVGGVHRKRALQTLALTVAFALPAFLWVSYVAPHWMSELSNNIASTSAHGDLNDPGLDSISKSGVGSVIDLQSAISVFRDDPRIYNPVSFLICGALLLVWLVRTLMLQLTQRRIWLALAAISALSMLPVYHRQYDAKLLLLSIPACVMLWAEGGVIGWLALLLNLTTAVFTGDIAQAIITTRSNYFHIGTSGIYEHILTALALRQVPLILLAMSIFYLWVYLRRAGPDIEAETAQ